MARPVPIIVPGPSGMGGSYKKTTAPNLLELIQGLSQIASLYQGTIGASKQKDTDALAVKNALRVAGISDNMEAPTPAGPAMDIPSGGVVNAPTPGGERLDLGALGRSSMGPEIAQKAIMAKFSNMFAPKNADLMQVAPGNLIVDKNNLNAPPVKVGEKVETSKSPHTQIVSDPTVKSGQRYMLWNDKTQAFDIKGNEAPRPQMDASARENLRFDALVSNAKQDPTMVQYLKVQGTLPRLERSYQQYKKTGNTAVLDDIVLYASQKMNDPDSVVMIGEYLRTKELQSLFHKAEGNILKVWKDTAGLAPKFREEFVDAVRSALKDKERLYDQRIEYYRGRGSKYNSDVEEVKRAFPMSSDKMEAVSGLTSEPTTTTGGSKFKIISVE